MEANEENNENEEVFIYWGIIIGIITDRNMFSFYIYS
jgi:hypothetical protein